LVAAVLPIGAELGEYRIARSGAATGSLAYGKQAGAFAG
jgi:hypothetical protein